MRKWIAAGISLTTIAAPAGARVDLTASVSMANTRYSFDNGKKNLFAGWHDAQVTFVTGTEIEAMAKQDPAIAKATKTVFTASKQYAIVRQQAPGSGPVTYIAEFDHAPQPCGETFEAGCLGKGQVNIRALDYVYRVFNICVNGASCVGR